MHLIEYVKGWSPFSSTITSQRKIAQRGGSPIKVWCDRDSGSACEKLFWREIWIRIDASQAFHGTCVVRLSEIGIGIDLRETCKRQKGSHQGHCPRRTLELGTLVCRSALHVCTIAFAF